MTAKETSLFCAEVSMLLSAAISLDEGLYTMAADAPTAESKQLLTGIAESLEKGTPFADALAQTGAYPAYVVQMAQVGQQTGTLDFVMGSLSDYYRKEHQLAHSIKSALTYPLVMIFMLVLVFFVLLTKVMPIFEGIYIQVGAQLSDLAKNAVSVGSILCGALIVLFVGLGLVAVVTVFFAKRGKSFSWAENLAAVVKEKSSIATAISKRRFTSVMSLTIKSGLDTDKGLELALNQIDQKKFRMQIEKCRINFDGGMDFYEAMKSTQLFGGMDLQMLKIGTRAGRLDVVMEQLAERFEQQVDDSIDKSIGRFEPTAVAVLAVAVGMILFSVMMPLVGILSSIG